MDKQKINKLNNIIKDYNQFIYSHLIEDIQSVLFCNRKQAFDFADSHCNPISLYALLYADDKIDISYKQFFRNLLDADFVRKNGFIKVLKEEIYSYYNIPFNNPLTFFEDYEDLINPSLRLNPNKFYQLKIKGHYMACYVDDNNELRLSDTSTRGINKRAKDFVKQSQFKWLLEI